MKAVIDNQIEVIVDHASQSRKRGRIGPVHVECCDPVFLEQDLTVDVGAIDPCLRQEVPKCPK